jgi:hypothetical protein
MHAEFVGLMVDGVDGVAMDFSPLYAHLLAI